MKIKILMKGKKEHDEIEVDAWILDDPPGWYQLFQEDRVILNRLSNVEAFELPRLRPEAEREEE